MARADEAYRRALELEPDLPEAHKLYAHREAEIGRAKDALVRLLGLARTARNDPETFAGLVHACRYCGLLEASEAAHREARRLDPHISTSVVYTWWAKGDIERVIAETSDAGDFELRTMAFLALGQEDEARKTLELPSTSFSPVFGTIKKGLEAMIDGRAEAAEIFAGLAATHSDPEAMFMYGALMGRLGDSTHSLAALTACVDGGFSVPQAFAHPWLASLRAPSATSRREPRPPAARPSRPSGRPAAPRFSAREGSDSAGLRSPRSLGRPTGPRPGRPLARRRLAARARPRLPLDVDPAVRDEGHEGPDRGDGGAASAPTSPTVSGNSATTRSPCRTTTRRTLPSWTIRRTSSTT